MSDEGSKKNPKKKVKRAFDKIVMGAIIGGAIGSVLGMSIAPKKGKRTRKLIKSKAKKAVEKGRKFLEEHEEEIETIKQVAREKGEKVIEIIDSNISRSPDLDQEELKQIPHEE